jgi:hypothetical protein
MEIFILGTGGAINKGLPYNAFVVDRTHLCEMPPDIMITIPRHGFSVMDIDTVFISHFHADHIFGLPFFMLDRFLRVHRTGKDPALTVFGPAGIAKAAKDLLATAFGVDHPSIVWMCRRVLFVEIGESSRRSFVPDHPIRYWRLDHPVPTFGYTFYRAEGSALFCYISDSVWGPGVTQMVSEKPEAVIVDLNGSRSDEPQMHICREDVIEKGLPITLDKTVYYGTHLLEEFTASDPRIKCAKPGAVYYVK